MRKILILFLAVTVMTVLAACSLKITLTPITEPPTSPTGAATEAPPVTGWQLVDGKWYCYNSEGKPLRGWITDKGSYLASTKTFTPREGVEVEDGYVERIHTIVRNRIKYSHAVGDYNYFNSVQKALQTLVPTETTE